jgi:hypothetical protein
LRDRREQQRESGDPRERQRVDPEACEEEQEPVSGRDLVPESEVSGWKPQAMLPAISPTRPISNTTTSVYVTVAKHLPGEHPAAVT